MYLLMLTSRTLPSTRGHFACSLSAEIRHVVGKRGVMFGHLSGKALSRYSNKTERLGLRNVRVMISLLKRVFKQYHSNQFSLSFAYNMAAKAGWHRRCGTK